MLVVVLLLFCLGETESAGDSYVAAVYEHRVILNPNPRVPVTRREALIHMQKNLDIYEEQAAKAAQQVGCWTGKAEVDAHDYSC